MTRYAVFENGKPCTTKTLNEKFGKFGTHFTSAHGWDNNEFDAFAEAQKYANKWLGECFGGIVFEPNVPVDYGYGGIMEIRTI